jgi:tetratricopeptide (TPR) repeat protein
MRFAVRGREAWSWLAIGLLAALPPAAWVRAAEDERDQKPSVEARGPGATEALAGGDQTGSNASIGNDPPPLLPEAADDEDPAEAEDLDSRAPDDPSEVEPSRFDQDPAAEPRRELKPKKPAARKFAHPGLLTTAHSETPVADRQIDAASIKGIQPGKTTRDELHAQWGKPNAVEKVAGGVRETFSLEPFDRVRVMIVENVVDSMNIRLEKPIALDQVAKRLQLEDVEPVQVFDDKGQLLGQAYPERGVLFGFTPKADSPHVFQVVVEPIDAQSFLARAEVRLPSRYAECLADLNQALQLAPRNGRGHWLYARLALQAGELQQAIKSAQKAIELDPEELDYHLTMAKVLVAAGDYPHALRKLRDVVESTKAAPIVAAKAHGQLGDCVAAAPERDFQQALKHHMDAVKSAESLLRSPSAVVRRAAKELLVNANLALAHDVGWGRWQHKSNVAPQWIERASTYAEEIVTRDRGSLEIRLRVHEGALAALAGIGAPPDASKWIRGTTETGSTILGAPGDTGYKAQIAWRVGVALCDAMEIESSRNHPDKALELGKLALANFALGDPAGRELPTHDYVRGKLCFRLGTVFSIERADHKQAVTWFDQAVPLLESPVPACAAVDPGRQGEAFVSMAVSYWEVNNRREAVRLTSQGAKLMEQAANEGLLSKAGLAVPYSNLASMHEQLGELKEAKEFAEMAARFEEAAPK